MNDPIEALLPKLKNRLGYGGSGGPVPVPLSPAADGGEAWQPAPQPQGWQKPAPGWLPGFQVPGQGFGGNLPSMPSLPSFADGIKNDPLFLQLQKDLSAQGVSDAAQRAAMTRRALIQFGMVPGFDQLSGVNADWLNADVDDQTRQLAQQNTAAGLSIAARQQQAFKDQVRNIRGALAARGALRSGEQGHGLQQAQTEYDQAKFDSTQELMDFIGGLQAGFAQQERARQEQLRAGAGDAAQRTQPPGPVRSRTVAPAGRAAPADPADLLEVLRGVGGRNYQAL